jgi:hypothetical protein
MPAMDATHWRRAGYIPASDAARALSMPVMTLHRWVDRHGLKQERQGQYRFVFVNDLVAHVRRIITDKRVADQLVTALRRSAKGSEHVDRGSEY